MREIFREWPPADVAEVILDMPEDEQVIIFRVLPQRWPPMFSNISTSKRSRKLLRAMAHEQVVGILNEMSPDDRTALLEEMPSAAARQLIRLLTPEERRVAQALLGYPEDSVGRLMTPDFIAVHDDWTVKEVLDYVREHGQDSETLNVIYVVDERGKLIDDLRIREFLLRPLDGEGERYSRSQTFVAPEGERFAGRSAQRFSKIRPRGACRWWIPTTCWSASSPSTTCSTSRKRRRPKTSRNSAVWKRWMNLTCASRCCGW